MGQAIVRSFTDGTVLEANPDRVFYQHVLLRAQNASGARARAYLYTAPPFPPGAFIQSAKLIVQTQKASSLGTTLSVQMVSEPFVMSQNTWNNQPAVSGSIISVTKGAIPAEQVWEFDVTAHLRLVSQGANWYGWRLTSSRLDEMFSIFADDGGLSKRPRLEVEWADYPNAPANLSPSAKRIVSVSHPVLRYDFNDVSGDTTLAASRVQIIVGPEPVGTAWDSGAIPTSVPEINLADTSFPGLSIGQVAWWRVTAQDGAGLWSDWSTWLYDWAGWERRAQPTVNITSHTSGGIVEDPTPTVTWSFSGGSGTQGAYQLSVFSIPRRNTLWTSGKISSSSTRAMTIPPGILKSDDTEYVLHLRVWDTYAREATPGDPPYVVSERRVTFDRDGSLTPVTGLTATPVNEGSAVKLTWSRATAPNRWAMVRNGTVVAVFDAADLSVPGGYEWVDYTANPRRNLTYEAAPIIGNTTGKNGPEVSVYLEPEGVWLTHPDTGDCVVIWETGDDLGWTMGEDSQVHIPLGGRTGVKLTQGMRGYEGHVTGTLESSNGRTAQDFRDQFLRFKETPSDEFRLIAQDQNIPVTILDGFVSPYPIRDEVRFSTGFYFTQSGEFDFDPEL